MGAMPKSARACPSVPLTVQIVISCNGFAPALFSVHHSVFIITLWVKAAPNSHARADLGMAPNAVNYVGETSVFTRVFQGNGEKTSKSRYIRIITL
jgi:hypothetical protein